MAAWSQASEREGDMECHPEPPPPRHKHSFMPRLYSGAAPFPLLCFTIGLLSGRRFVTAFGVGGFRVAGRIGAVSKLMTGARGIARASSGGGEAASVASAAVASPLHTLETLPFDNRALRSLPIDPEQRNFIRADVSDSCFSRVTPTPVDKPVMASYSSSCLELLGLPESEVLRPDAAEFFSGNKLLPGAEPAAHCYCGHQFGSFAGQLGDGAAMYLGEIDRGEENGGRWELQFKGAGKTPYSRSADGRKVLRSSLREFLCSEAMHHLGIPTTRAGTLVTSDSTVQRDAQYDGNVQHERCTIITRVARTFLRFGSFEIFKAPDSMTGRKGPSHGNTALLRQMLDYTITSFFPQIQLDSPIDPSDSEEKRQNCYLSLFKEVARLTAELVASWNVVGWTHGVLNTDNMSILGLTIDYGPYGFMEHFSGDFVPNGSDGSGRYRFSTQTEMCRWNLGKFAEALAPVLPVDISIPELKESYDDVYDKAYQSRMRAKLGLLTEEEGDSELFASLFEVMASTAADFTSTFRALMKLEPTASEGEGADANADAVALELASICATPQVLAKALQRKLKISRPSVPPEQLTMLWQIAQDDPDALAARWGAPKEAIISELKQEMDKLTACAEATHRAAELRSMSEQSKVEEDKEEWLKWVHVFRQRLGKEAERQQQQQHDRLALMGTSNPAFVLRNWIAQEAIAAAEDGDFSVVNGVLKRLESPFQELDPSDHFAKRPPSWASELICTCSS